MRSIWYRKDNNWCSKCVILDRWKRPTWILKSPVRIHNRVVLIQHDFRVLPYSFQALFADCVQCRINRRSPNIAYRERDTSSRSSIYRQPMIWACRVWCGTWYFILLNWSFNLLELNGQGLTSVADPHRKNADADPGKNLSGDADSCPYWAMASHLIV